MPTLSLIESQLVIESRMPAGGGQLDEEASPHPEPVYTPPGTVCRMCKWRASIPIARPVMTFRFLRVEKDCRRDTSMTCCEEAARKRLCSIDRDGGPLLAGTAVTCRPRVAPPSSAYSFALFRWP